MAYRLKSSDSVSEDLQKIVKKQLESALDRLTDENRHDPAVSVHQARKNIKKIRAVLRLVRAELGSAYSPLNRKLRSAGRKLSEMRDAAVMIEAFDKINKKYADELNKGTVEGVRRRLAARKKRVYKEAKARNLLADVSNALHACLKLVKKWPTELDGLPAVVAGIETTFRRARRAMKRARKHPQAENLHAWRKRVKDHWYQTRLVAGLPGDSIRVQEKDLEKLETCLGEHHNLTVLREKTIGQAGLASVIDRYQDELRHTALALGKRIYEEKPRR